MTKNLRLVSRMIYVKSTCRFFSFLTYLLLLMSLYILILMSIEPCFLIVEFKPPVTKPVLLSSRDLSAKSAIDEKSIEIDSSKSVMVLSPLTSPAYKKLKFNPTTATMKSDTSMPLVAYGYSIDGDMKSFPHLLDDSLLPQFVEGHSFKIINKILGYSAADTFHVSICTFQTLFC